MMSGEVLTLVYTLFAVLGGLSAFLVFLFIQKAFQ